VSISTPESLEDDAPVEPAQQGFDPGQKLEKTEGLGHVVVGPEAKAPHLVGFFAARRQDEDRHREAFRPERAQDAKAVGARQHQIEDHEIRPARPGQLQPDLAVRRHLDLVPVDLQVVAKAEREVEVVLDEKDAAHRGNSTTKRAPLRSPPSTQDRPP
jgi:hypothetical protein